MTGRAEGAPPATATTDEQGTSDDPRAARKDALVEALGNGATHEQAGHLVGVSSKTVQRLFSEPEFKRAVSL